MAKPDRIPDDDVSVRGYVTERVFRPEHLLVEDPKEFRPELNGQFTRAPRRCVNPDHRLHVRRPHAPSHRRPWSPARFDDLIEPPLVFRDAIHPGQRAVKQPQHGHDVSKTSETRLDIRDRRMRESLKHA